MTSPVLVVGAPRSGTTWVAETLAAGPSTFLVHEPDNHRLWPAAARAKAGLGRHPVLAAADIGSRPTARYDELWTAAAAGADNQSLGRAGTGEGLRLGWRARRSVASLLPRPWVDSLLAGSPGFGSRIVAAAGALVPTPPPVAAPIAVIKSVQATFALDYVSTLIDAPVVLVRRDPRNAVASWLDLGWSIPRYEDDPAIAASILEPAGIEPPPPGSDATELAWAYLLLDYGMVRAARAHPDWKVVQHEDLCDEPAAGFRSICESVGVPWTPEIERALDESDGDGDGYVTTRKRSEQRNRWRSRLDAAQLADIAAVKERFDHVLD